MQPSLYAAQWVDAAHVLLVVFLGVGWLLPRGALPLHILLCFATLAGWCAFGFCFLTEISNELRANKRPGDKFKVFIGLRHALLSCFECTRQK